MSDAEFEWILAICFPPVLALVWLGLSYSAARTAMRGRPLTPFLRSLIKYGFLFILGIGYDMAFTKRFALSPQTLWLTGPTWGVFLIAVAWWRQQRTKAAASAQEQVPDKPKITLFAEGLPVVGLIVFLVASLITLEMWAEGGTHLWPPLLCAAGAAAMIVLARRNRRIAVITALRAVVALGVIGVIGHPSQSALITVGIIGVILVLLEKLWKKSSDPPALDGTDTLFSKPNHPPSGQS